MRKNKKAKDIYGREINEGDFVIAIESHSAGRSELETLYVKGISPAGFLKTVGSLKLGVHKPESRCVLVEPEFLPEDVYFDLLDQAKIS